MPDSHTIHIYGVGEVLLQRSLRTRRIVISISPFKGVRVSVPRRASLKEAGAFAGSKTEWIKKHLEKVRQIEHNSRSMKAEFDSIDVAEAGKILSRRLRKLATQHSFKYNRITIRRQRTRWGSCSAKNNISLNARLVKLPDELRDYVILHELVHTRIHNHSRKFWAELDKYVDDPRVMAKKLRNSGLELV